MAKICQTIRQLTNDQLIIKEGSLYPALYKLKEDGLVKVEAVKVGNRVRQYYTLVRTSGVSVKEQVNEFSMFLKTMNSLFNTKTSY